MKGKNMQLRNFFHCCVSGQNNTYIAEVILQQTECNNDNNIRHPFRPSNETRNGIKRNLCTKREREAGPFMSYEGTKGELVQRYKIDMQQFMYKWVCHY